MSTKQLDVRCWVYCNLGTVISGSIEESTIVGAGLVNVTGTVTLSGVYRIKKGTVIELAYYKNNRVARIGRRMRVLSVYANPTTRTTELSIGCLLTYHKDNEPPPTIVNSEDDTDTPDLTDLEKRLMLKPTKAKYIAKTICDKLGIDYAPIPLTNEFYQEAFEISGPYLNVLSDLLISEGYVGYMDTQERLRFIDLNEQSGVGPVLDETKIIDITPINSGDPPADVVYSTIKYTGVKLDDALTEDTGETEEEILERNGLIFEYNGFTYQFFGRVPAQWLKAESSSGVVSKVYSYDDTEVTVSWSDYTQTQTLYEAPFGTSDYKLRYVNTTRGGQWGPIQETTEYRYSGDPPKQSDLFNPVAPGEGGAIPTVAGQSTVITTKTVVEPAEALIESMGLPSDLYPPLPYTYARVAAEASVGYVTTELTTTESLTVEQSGIPVPGLAKPGYTRTITTKKVPFFKTADGSAYIQKLIQSATITQRVDGKTIKSISRGRVVEIVNLGLSLASVPAEVSFQESMPSFSAPSGTGGPDEENPENGYTYSLTETSEIIFERKTKGGINLELTPPFMSDDKVEKVGDYYKVTPSDAKDKAKNFAYTQNRLRTGYRNGQSIVYPIEYAPINPFKPLYLSFGGVVGQFRSDKTTIAFDASGILVSTDAIFWGGVGR